MKKEKLETLVSFLLGMFGLIFTAFLISVFASSCTSRDAAADNYIKELEATLEINDINIDDTVGASDAYAEYYNL